MGELPLHRLSHLFCAEKDKKMKIALFTEELEQQLRKKCKPERVLTESSSFCKYLESIGN